MTSVANPQIAKLALTVATAISLSGCATPGLDRRIATLNQNISDERQVLAPLAGPYRGRVGQDVQFDVVGRPLEDVVEKFNSLSPSDRTIVVTSYRYSGYIAESWTDCLFNTRIGFKVVPAFEQAFAGVLYVDHIDHSWNENDGLAFRLHNSIGAAGMIIGGETELCGLKGTIPIGLAAIVLGAASATGSTSLDPPSGDGITYHVRLTQPIYMIAYVVTPVFDAPVPLWFKPELTKGKIPTTLGSSGTVMVTPAGQQRNYTIAIRLDQADFLPVGLSASGKVDVNWKPTITIAPTSAAGAPPFQSIHYATGSTPLSSQ